MTKSFTLTFCMPFILMGARYYYSRKVILNYLDCALHTDMADIEAYYMKPTGKGFYTYALKSLVHPKIILSLLNLTLFRTCMIFHLLCKKKSSQRKRLGRDRLSHCLFSLHIFSFRSEYEIFHFCVCYPVNEAFLLNITICIYIYLYNM